jgi:hypothetical protein
MERHHLEDLGIDANIKAGLKEMGWEIVDWIYKALERNSYNGSTLCFL